MSMLMNDRLEIAREISPPLLKLEAGIEAVFENSGVLMLAIARGRLRARVPFADGLEAMQQIYTCVGRAIEGATAIDELHKTLDAMRRDFGVPLAALGDYGVKPKFDDQTGELSPMRSIA